MNKRSSLAWLLLLSSFVTTLGQTPQQTAEPQSDQDDVVRITTNLVQIDAVVTDKKGQPVTNLTADDFEITEDGRPQKITNLSYVSTASATPAAEATPAPVLDKNGPPAPPTRLRPEKVRRTIALVVDDLGLSFQSMYYVRRALKKFVDEQMQPGDLVAIIRTGGGIGVLQQFTSDKRQLYASIERVRYTLLGRSGISPFAAIESKADAAEKPDNNISNSTDENNPSDDLNQFRSDIFAVGTLGAVNYIVRGLRDLPGRKSVLLISEGFKLFDRDNTSNNYRIQQALQHLIDQANRASVVIYTMDARGLVYTGLTAADSTSGLSPDELSSQLSDRNQELFDTQSGLIYLARETGGFNIRNTNDLSSGIKRVLEDQSGYYLIGYRPDESTFDPKTGQRRFHKISIKVKRGGLQVRSRTGFYGVTNERVAEGPRTREQQLVGALISPFNSNGIDLRLTSLFGNDPRTGSFVRSLLHIDAHNLSFTEEADGWRKTVIDVLALSFGDNGQIVDQVNRTQTIRVRGETYQKVLKNGLVYFLNLPVKKPGAYQMRVAVRDAATAQVGSAGQFIEVPDIGKKRLTLSGIVISGYEPKAGSGAPSAAAPAAASAGAQGTAANKAEGAQEEPDPQAGPAVRHFRRGMVVNFGYIIYNAQLDKATRRPQLETQLRVFRDGQPVFVGKKLPFVVSNQPDLTRLIAGGGLQLGTDMTPGEYVLQVVVTDLLAKEKYRTTTQWIDFEIVR